MKLVKSHSTCYCFHFFNIANFKGMLLAKKKNVGVPYFILSLKHTSTHTSVKTMRNVFNWLRLKFWLRLQKCYTNDWPIHDKNNYLLKIFNRITHADIFSTNYFYSDSPGFITLQLPFTWNKITIPSDRTTRPTTISLNMDYQLTEVVQLDYRAWITNGRIGGHPNPVKRHGLYHR